MSSAGSQLFTIRGAGGVIKGNRNVYYDYYNLEKERGIERKKLKNRILPNLPYLFFALLFTKIGQTVRYAPGSDITGKALHILEGFSLAMQIR